MAERDGNMRHNDVVPPGADPVEPRDPHHRPVPLRWKNALLFSIPAVLLLLLGIGWMTFMERDDSGGYASPDPIGTTGDTGQDPEGERRTDTLNPQPEGPPVIAALELLTQADDYAGRPVNFAAIKVIGTNGDRTFWVGRIGNRTLVVVDPSARNTAPVQRGQMIRLAGRLERTPSDDQLGRFGVSGEDRDALAGEDVFILANEIEVTRTAGPLQSEIPVDRGEHQR